MQIAIKKVILRSVSKNAMKLFVHYSTLFFIAFLSMEHTKKQAFKLTTVCNLDLVTLLVSTKTITKSHNFTKLNDFM